MFPLDCSVGSVCRLPILDVRFIMSVHSLPNPSIVIFFSNLLEVTTSHVCANDANSEHVAIVHKQKASSEIGPRERHFYN